MYLIECFTRSLARNCKFTHLGDQLFFHSELLSATQLEAPEVDFPLSGASYHSQAHARVPHRCLQEKFVFSIVLHHVHW